MRNNGTSGGNTKAIQAITVFLSVKLFVFWFATLEIGQFYAAKIPT